MHRIRVEQTAWLLLLDTRMLVALKAAFLENYLAISTWILNGSSIECHEKKHQPISLSGAQFGSRRLCCSRKYPYPPTEGFLVWTPPTPTSGNPILVSYFPSKNWAFEIPPLEFPLTFLGVGMELHIQISGWKSSWRWSGRKWAFNPLTPSHNT